MPYVKHPVLHKEYLEANKSLIKFVIDHHPNLSFSNENITLETLLEFVDREILKDVKKNIKHLEAVEKNKQFNDLLMDQLYNILQPKEYMTLDEILDELDDPRLSKSIIVNRLTQLRKKELVEYDWLPQEAVSGHPRKLRGYRRKS